MDEQNGFRLDRSCQDHIFSLSSIVRNTQANNKPTFAAFVDMHKAYDWVGRDKLLSNNNDGHIYNAITSMYINTLLAFKLITKS